MNDLNVQISVQTVADVINLIDTVAARGAFRGPELTGIGLMRQSCVDIVEQYNAEATKRQAVEAFVVDTEANKEKVDSYTEAVKKGVKLLDKSLKEDNETTAPVKPKPPKSRLIKESSSK